MFFNDYYQRTDDDLYLPCNIIMKYMETSVSINIKRTIFCPFYFDRATSFNQIMFHGSVNTGDADFLPMKIGLYNSDEYGLPNEVIDSKDFDIVDQSGINVYKVGMTRTVNKGLYWIAIMNNAVHTNLLARFVIRRGITSMDPRLFIGTKDWINLPPRHTDGFSFYAQNSLILSGLLPNPAIRFASETNPFYFANVALRITETARNN